MHAIEVKAEIDRATARLKQRIVRLEQQIVALQDALWTVAGQAAEGMPRDSAEDFMTVVKAQAENGDDNG